MHLYCQSVTCNRVANLVFLCQVVREEDCNRVSCAGRMEVGVKMTVSEVYHPAVMAVNVHCIVNVSLCNLVKMYADLRFCSLAAPYLNVFTSAMASAGLSALGSTWLQTPGLLSGASQKRLPPISAAPAPPPALQPRPGLWQWHTQGSVLPALSASPSFQVRLGEPSVSLVWVELCHASHQFLDF